MKTDSKNRAYDVNETWVMVHTEIYMALRLREISWWRLASEGALSDLWCLDLAAGDRLLKLYFDDERQGLSWLRKWLDVPAPQSP